MRTAGILSHRTKIDCYHRLSPSSAAVFHHMFGNPMANPDDAPVRHLSEWVAPDRPITYGILKPGPDVPDGVPYVRVADMKDRRIEVGGVRRTSASIAGKYRRSSLRVGDLLMSIRGHVGRFAFVPDELAGANITQDSARLSLSSHAAAVYVRAAMETASGQRWMATRTRGAAVRGINLGDLRQFPLPVPSSSMLDRHAAAVAGIENQRRVVSRQSSAADSLFASLRARAFRGEL